MVEEQLPHPGLVVGVAVDEPRHDPLARRVDYAGAAWPRAATRGHDGRDAIPVDKNIHAGARWRTRPVDEGRVHDNEPAGRRARLRRHGTGAARHQGEQAEDEYKCQGRSIHMVSH